MPQQAGFISYGNIWPSVAVKFDRTAGHAFGVVAAVAAADVTAGIAQEGTKIPALATYAEAKYAAAAGQTLKVYQEGDICLAQISSTAGTVRGDLLGVDVTNGFVGVQADNFGNATGGGAGVPDGSLTPIAVVNTGGTAVAGLTLTSRWIVAQALETANANELCRVVVTKFIYSKVA